MGPCEIQLNLITQAQAVLIRISETAREQATAIKAGEEDRVLQLDEDIEKLLGEKERYLGALRQHRNDHGC